VRQEACTTGAATLCWQARCDGRHSFAPAASLLRADLVLARSPTSCLGIVLPMPSSSVPGATRTGTELCVLLPWGSIVIFIENDVMLRLPNLIGPELAALAAPADMAHIVSTEGIDPTEDASPKRNEQEPFDAARFGARSAACAALRALTRMSETEMLRLRPAFREVCLSKEGVALIEEEGTAYMPSVAYTILQRTMQAEGYCFADVASARVAQPVLLAVHRMLMDTPSRFVADDIAHRSSHRFSLRSDREREAIETVDEWVRAPKGSTEWRNLEGFGQRAKQVLAWRAKLGGETLPADEPERVELEAEAGPGVQWRQTDHVILRFLRSTLSTRRSLQGYEYLSIAMDVLKRAGADVTVQPVAHRLQHPERSFTDVPRDLVPYGRDTGDAGIDHQGALVVRFLQAVGEMPPWEDHALLQVGVDFTTNERDAPSETPQPTPRPKLALHEAEMERFDFEQLPVHVIDDPTAHELDDGISIERVAGKDEIWIHVHVADPTSIMDPADDLARRARRQHNTLYLPEGRWPLLPDEMLQAGRLSLGSKSETEEQREERQKHGLCALTFSARVDAQGKVQEYCVRPSIVHNVQITTYDEVSAALEVDGTSDLHVLQRFARAMLHQRVANSSIASNMPGPNFTLSPVPLPGAPATPSTQTLFRGFPKIDIGMLSLEPPAWSKAQDLVSECMLLAGRVAGACAADRGVPLVYRSQEAPEAAAAAKLRGLRDEDGNMSWLTLLRSGVRLAPGNASHAPAPHFALGISPALDDAAAHGGYARSTSPLRRYPDIVAHWQLKASLAGRTAPWSQERLEADMPRMARMDAWSRSLERRVRYFWMALGLRRLLDAPPGSLTPEEQALLGPLDAVVALPDVRINPSRLDARVRVFVPQLGINAECGWHRSIAAAELGAPLKVRLHDVVRAGVRSSVIVVPEHWNA
jgi:hypothetical protein